MYKRRLKIFLILMAVAEAVLIGRLAQLQLIHGELYRRQAESLLAYEELLPTGRGRILDRRGNVLAENKACYDFCLHYRMLKGPGATEADRKAYRRWADGWIKRIARRENITLDRAKELLPERMERTWRLAETITGGTRNEMARAAEEIVGRVETWRRIVGGPVKEEYLSHPVASVQDEETKVRLQGCLDRMVGASVRPSHRRSYPFKELACHLIGLLGPVGEDELARTRRNRSLPIDARLGDYLPEDRRGLSGAEKLCEGMLRGRRGYRRRRRTGEILEEVPARTGPDVHLTIDADLQRALARVFRRRPDGTEDRQRCGAVVVIDVPSGEVLAMVSQPTYDPNEYRRRLRALTGDRVDLPLIARAFAARYPPGSTVKPLVAVAGLTSGVIHPGEEIYCRGYLLPNAPDRFRCWIWLQYHRTHGPLEVVGALEHSCNIFFYTVGRRLRLRRLHDWFAAFGFADRPGTGLPGERSGSLPDPNAPHDAGVPWHLAIGQGPISVTPLHVANAIATIARGGQFRTPVLVRELAGRQRRRDLKVSPETIRLVQEGMYRVVNSSSGTGRAARDYEIEICGKTGTAKTTPRRVDGRIVRSGDTAWFAGFAPYRNPRIAFAVMVEYSDKGGGPTCGPIARQVVRTCRDYLAAQGAWPSAR